MYPECSASGIARSQTTPGHCICLFAFLGGGGVGGGGGGCGLGALLVNFCILEVHVATQIRAHSTGLH